MINEGKASTTSLAIRNSSGIRTHSHALLSKVPVFERVGALENRHSLVFPPSQREGGRAMGESTHYPIKNSINKSVE